MFVETFCTAVNGMEITTVTVEVSITRGVLFHLTGLADGAVEESRGHITVALLNTGYEFPVADTAANLAPADLEKVGSSFGLPLTIATLSANEKMGCDRLREFMFVGELSLDGTLQPIKGILPIATKARAEEFKGVIVPKANKHEAAVVDTLEICGMDNILQVIDFLNSTSNPESYFVDTQKRLYEHQYAFDLDSADIRGQENVKRALEVAAAGGHNLIMARPPGSGKNMITKRLPSILPPSSLSESLGTTQIHSITSELRRDTGLITQHPFRSPHHTISEVALAGGGANPMSGKITLVHSGVLFCDELPEFNERILEVPRQPLEDRHITISRAKYTAAYPCNLVFVASMNPYPCDYFANPIHHCVCTPGQIQKYLAKVSGPLMGRIDIQREIAPLPFGDVLQATPGESSAAIRERVIRARAIRTGCFNNYCNIHCDAQISERMIHGFAEPDETSTKLLRGVMERLELSARAYNRILEITHSIADLEESEAIQIQHIAEAIGYRNLDRGDWAER